MACKEVSLTLSQTSEPSRIPHPCHVLPRGNPATGSEPSRLPVRTCNHKRQTFDNCISYVVRNCEVKTYFPPKNLAHFIFLRDRRTDRRTLKYYIYVCLPLWAIKFKSHVELYCRSLCLYHVYYASNLHCISVHLHRSFICPFVPPSVCLSSQESVNMPSAFTI